MPVNKRMLPWMLCCVVPLLLGACATPVATLDSRTLADVNEALAAKSMQPLSVTFNSSRVTTEVFHAFVTSDSLHFQKSPLSNSPRLAVPIIDVIEIFTPRKTHASRGALFGAAPGAGLLLATLIVGPGCDSGHCLTEYQLTVFFTSVGAIAGGLAGLFVGGSATRTKKVIYYSGPVSRYHGAL